MTIVASMVRSPNSAAKKASATVSTAPNLRASCGSAPLAPSSRNDHNPKAMKPRPANKLIQKSGNALPSTTPRTAEIKLITSVALTTPAITTRTEYRVEKVSVMNCVLSPISATKTNINANQNAVVELEERF